MNKRLVVGGVTRAVNGRIWVNVHLRETIGTLAAPPIKRIAGQVRILAAIHQGLTISNTV